MATEGLIIKPGAALEDAKQIETIVETIQECLRKLDECISKNIPNELETTWSKELDDAWQKSYKGSIQDIMDEMKSSATEVQKAVFKALDYSQSAE